MSYLKYKDIIKLKFPNKNPQSFGNSNLYSDIVWSSLDNTPNPTKAELDALIISVENENPEPVIGSSGEVIDYYNNIATHSWSIITNKPTTLVGYGITEVPWSNITGTPSILPSLTSTTQVTPASGTTLIPYDNSLPLIKEGTEIVSSLYSASSVDSKLCIEGSLVIDCSNSTRIFIITLFRDSVCIGTAAMNFITAGKPQIFSISFSDLNLGSTFGTIVTYSLRIGVASSATWYVNRMASNVFNSTMGANSIILSEYI